MLIVCKKDSKNLFLVLHGQFVRKARVNIYYFLYIVGLHVVSLVRKKSIVE